MPNEGQNARVVFPHDPSRHRQPIIGWIEFELMERALDDLRAAIRPSRKVEACEGGAEVTDCMRGVHFSIRAYFLRGGHVVLDDECQPLAANPLRHAFDRDSGRELSAALCADAFAENFAAQGIGNAQ